MDRGTGMRRPQTARPDLGQPELTEIRRRSTGLLVMVFVFSMVVNALMLTGPIYMLQVYDRVLGSRS